jgi:hypothetical protein
VQQEPAQEFVNRQRHQTLFVFVSGIAPAKRNHAVGKCHESMIWDRHAMGVLAEIAKRMLRAAERAFWVNHPFGAERGAGGMRVYVLPPIFRSDAGWGTMKMYASLQ